MADSDKIYTDTYTPAPFQPAVGTAIKNAEYHIGANMKSLAPVVNSWWHIYIHIEDLALLRK